MTEEEATQTITKTLWSETVIELLVARLVTDKPDKEVFEVLSDIRDKGFEPDYLVEKIRKEIGDSYADRLERLLGAEKTG